MKYAVRTYSKHSIPGMITSSADNASFMTEDLAQATETFERWTSNAHPTTYQVELVRKYKTKPCDVLGRSVDSVVTLAPPSKLRVKRINA